MFYCDPLLGWRTGRPSRPMAHRHVPPRLAVRGDSALPIAGIVFHEQPVRTSIAAPRERHQYPHHVELDRLFERNAGLKFWRQTADRERFWRIAGSPCKLAGSSGESQEVLANLQEVPANSVGRLKTGLRTWGKPLDLGRSRYHVKFNIARLASGKYLDCQRFETRGCFLGQRFFIE